MQVLIVFSHPEPASFTSAMKDASVAALEAAGHTVVVSDLYRMGWEAALGLQDFGDAVPPFDVSRAQQLAVHEGTQDPAVAEEQHKVAGADLVLFHFPIWWYSMPAIMKGWIDRVFARGFAYAAGEKYDRGRFRGKRAMLVVTTGTASTLYEPGGIDGDLLHVLWPIHNGILAYTGFTVLPPFVAWTPGTRPRNEREADLTAWRSRLDRLDLIAPLFFHPTSDYDETQRLKPGVVARTGVQWNPLAGQTRDFTTRL